MPLAGDRNYKYFPLEKLVTCDQKQFFPNNELYVSAFKAVASKLDLLNATKQASMEKLGQQASDMIVEPLLPEGGEWQNAFWSSHHNFIVCTNRLPFETLLYSIACDHQQSTLEHTKTSVKFDSNVILLSLNPRDWYPIMYSKLTTSASTPSPPSS